VSSADEVGERDHWFEELADHLGSAYLRYSFTKGTANEVAFLVEALGLEPGMRVLDVGCGPGRHAHALGALGIEVHGVDISERFIELARVDAPDGVTFERADARHLTFAAAFDAAISLCQGAFGLTGGPAAAQAAADPAGPAGTPLEPDATVLHGIARALRPGGAAAVSAFSAYFQVRFLEDHDSFDADRGVNHERTEVRDADGVPKAVDLWTTCFTPRELRLLAADAGLRPEAIWSVTPGDYAARAPDLEHPELLLVARRPR
jgi:SAM-dependent methyltransferase